MKSIIDVVRRSLLRGSSLPALALVGAGLFAAPAFAQDAAAQAAPAAPTEADTTPDVVVTGSLFRRTDTETPSPVTVLTSENLARAGITTVSDAVRSISADNSGSIPTSFSNGFGAGSSAIALRGLTVNSTLTLIDGLRTANYPLADDGQRGFVDLNTIPDAIVDRIEVLKDGASASYGADAIAGVVNIIMKKEITGVSGTLENGVTQRGDGGERRGTLTIGHGHLNTDGYNFYISGEYQHDDAIYNRNRGFPFNTADLSGVGGLNQNPGSSVPGTTTSAIVAPTNQQVLGNVLSGDGTTSAPWQILGKNGCAAGQKTVTAAAQGTNLGGTGCEQNTASDYGQIQPSQTRWGLTAHGTVQINPDTQAYAMVSYYQSNVKASYTPNTIRSTNPINTQNIVLPAHLADGSINPNDPFATTTGQAAAIRYLFGDIQRNSEYDNHVIRGAAGVDGRFGDGFNYKVDATAAHSWLDITQNGYINLNALETAINTGTYNFVDPTQNSAAVRAALSPAVRTRATSDEDMIQGVVTKDLFQLPGGALQLGVGGSVRYEAVNDPNSNADESTLSLNAFTAKGHHWVESSYFEINAPILSVLEIDGSGRFDHYSEGYSHFSPKVGAKFTPIKELAIRGTFSKGFRAPSFAETNGTVIGYTSATLPCSAQVQHGAAVNSGVCSGGSSYNQNYSIGYNTAANPNLKPELSTSFTAGFVAQPVKWLSFTVDYYNIKKTRVIVGGPLSGQAYAAYYAGTALPAGYTITQDAIDPAYPNAIRRILYVNAPYANAAGLKTSGIDASLQIQAHLTDTVKFISRAEGTYILHYDFKTDDASPYEDFVGTQAPYITSSGAGTPQFRGNWQNTIEAGAYSLSATAYYTSGYAAVAYDQFGGTDCASSATYGDGDFNCHVRRFIDVDMNASVKINDKFQLYLNVMNVFDAKAPLNAGNYAATNYNPTYTQAGAIGRAFRAGANFKF